MPRNGPKKDAENSSFYLTVGCRLVLAMMADLSFFGNKTQTVESAIWNLAGGKLAETPEGKKLLINMALQHKHNQEEEQRRLGEL